MIRSLRRFWRSPLHGKCFTADANGERVLAAAVQAHEAEALEAAKADASAKE